MTGWLMVCTVFSSKTSPDFGVSPPIPKSTTSGSQAEMPYCLRPPRGNPIQRRRQHGSDCAKHKHTHTREKKWGKSKQKRQGNVRPIIAALPKVPEMELGNAAPKIVRYVKCFILHSVQKENHSRYFHGQACQPESRRRLVSVLIILRTLVICVVHDGEKKKGKKFLNARKNSGIVL